MIFAGVFVIALLVIGSRKQSPEALKSDYDELIRIKADQRERERLKHLIVRSSVTRR
jgi:hypothetical protein